MVLTLSESKHVIIGTVCCVGNNFSFFPYVGYFTVLKCC